MAKDSPAQSLDRIMVRLPKGMREKLATLAKEAGRSVNAEVVARLESSFESDAAAKQMAELVEQHETNISELWLRVDKLESEVSDINRYGPGER